MNAVNVVVETEGTMRFIYHDELAGLLELGPSSTVRASHVEPHETGGLRIPSSNFKRPTSIFACSGDPP